MEDLVQEIKSFFPEFRISVHDLKNPTNTFVRDFYCRVLIELGVDVDNVRKVQMAQTDTHYPTEVDIIPELNLVSAIRYVFPFIKFTLDDLLSPDVKRNAMHISKVMNFLQFCETRLADNYTKLENFQEAKNQERELAKIKDKETMALSNLVCELDSCRQSKHVLEESVGKLKPEVDKSKKVAHTLNDQYKEAEKVFHEKQEKIQSQEKEIEALEKEIDEHRKMIVENPEEAQKKFDLINREKERVIESKMEFQEKYKEHRSVLEAQQKKVEDLRRKLDPVLAELHIIRQYSEARKSNTQTEDRVIQLEKRKEELIKSLNELDTKHCKEEKRVSGRLADLKQEEVSLSELLRGKESEYKTKLKEYKKTEKKCEEELEEVSKRILTYEEEYKVTMLKFHQVVQEIEAVRKLYNL